MYATALKTQATRCRRLRGAVCWGRARGEGAMIQCECTCVCCDTQTFVLPDDAAGQTLICPSCGRYLTPHTVRPFGEAEWLACNDPAVLVECAAKKATERKRRLFACACCRHLWRLLDRWDRELVQKAEQYADGLIARKELARAATTAGNRPDDVSWLAHEAAGSGPRASVVARWARRSGAEGAWLAALVRDIFGNPFRRPQLDWAWLRWEGGTVRKLAEGAYRDQAFDRLPVLADALEEAGCADEQLLAHCRGGPHARGCWAIDLLLGQE
jgi:hypothetical protein